MTPPNEQNRIDELERAYSVAHVAIQQLAQELDKTSRVVDELTARCRALEIRIRAAFAVARKT